MSLTAFNRMRRIQAMMPENIIKAQEAEQPEVVEEQPITNEDINAIIEEPEVVEENTEEIKEDAKIIEDIEEQPEIIEDIEEIEEEPETELTSIQENENTEKPATSTRRRGTRRINN